MAQKPKRKPSKKKETMAPRKLRFSPEDEARIQMRADMYAGGNFSKWVRYAAMECPGKVLVEA